MQGTILSLTLVSTCFGAAGAGYALNTRMLENAERITERIAKKRYLASTLILCGSTLVALVGSLTAVISMQP